MPDILIYFMLQLLADSSNITNIQICLNLPSQILSAYYLICSMTNRPNIQRVAQLTTSHICLDTQITLKVTKSWNVVIFRA